MRKIKSSGKSWRTFLLDVEGIKLTDIKKATELSIGQVYKVVKIDGYATIADKHKVYSYYKSVATQPVSFSQFWINHIRVGENKDGRN